MHSSGSVLNMKHISLLASALLCAVIPAVLGATTNEESLKQQIASGLARDDLWNSLNQARIYDSYPPRRFWVPQPYQKRFDSLSGDAFGLQKRAFDDRNALGNLVRFSRNFDEIDRTGLGFNKRNFDEIDRNGFGSFVKRAVL